MRLRILGPSSLAHREAPSAPSLGGLTAWILLATTGLAAPHPPRAQASPIAAPKADSASAPAPQLPADLSVKDAPDDDGKALRLSWEPPKVASPTAATALLIERGTGPSGPFERVDSMAAGTGEAADDSVARGRTFFYRVTALGPGGRSQPAVLGPAVPQAQWFRMGRVNVASFAVVFFGLVLFFLWSARGGRKLFIRRIPGIDAIEEAVGRATEMGRPVLYIPGIQDIDDIQTMASLVILESVARTTAQYDTKIIVPTNYPVVFTLAQEMVKNGYLQAGRPDAYDESSVRYVTTEQFAYVAAINGIILRDRPAANLYLGAFFAESLILAETGYATKAIQVAGTANIHQLPFMVVACDYTLIGEELYAASAYLSKEPRLLSTLKGSDYMKVAVIAIVLLGAVTESLGFTAFKAWFQTQ